jgi:hypothetical protein
MLVDERVIHSMLLAASVLVDKQSDEHCKFMLLAASVLVDK